MVVSWRSRHCQTLKTWWQRYVTLAQSVHGFSRSRSGWCCGSTQTGPGCWCLQPEVRRMQRLWGVKICRKYMNKPCFYHISNVSRLTMELHWKPLSSPWMSAACHRPCCPCPGTGWRASRWPCAWSGCSQRSWTHSSRRRSQTAARLEHKGDIHAMEILTVLKLPLTYLLISFWIYELKAC